MSPTSGFRDNLGPKASVHSGCHGDGSPQLINHSQVRCARVIADVVHLILAAIYMVILGAGVIYGGATGQGTKCK